MALLVDGLAAIEAPLDAVATSPSVLATVACAFITAAYRLALVALALRGTSPEQRPPILFALRVILPRSPDGFRTAARRRGKLASTDVTSRPNREQPTA